MEIIFPMSRMEEHLQIWIYSSINVYGALQSNISKTDYPYPKGDYLLN